MNKIKGKQGFASMDKEKQRMIASRGGKAAQESGRGHRWTPEEAKRAGEKGGKLFKTPLERERYFKKIGRNGGLARWGKKDEGVIIVE